MKIPSTILYLAQLAVYKVNICIATLIIHESVSARQYNSQTFTVFVQFAN